MPMDIQREIAALPALVFEGAVEESEPASPLQIVSKQGRLLLRLSASAEALDRQYATLVARMAERDARLEAQDDARRAAERQTRQTALAAIRLMDALDWVYDALAQRDQQALARDVDAARRDCLRRLASVGVSEIPCQGMMDPTLHEGLATAATDETPRYHIVRVDRRGFQCGPDVLRRAGVTTAA